MNKPQPINLSHAMGKFERLLARSARPRTLRRLSSRIDKLRDDYDRRLEAWKAEQVKP